MPVTRPTLKGLKFGCLMNRVVVNTIPSKIAR